MRRAIIACALLASLAPAFASAQTCSPFTSCESRGAAGGGEGSGTVTSVASGAGLTGGPITTTGTLAWNYTATLAGNPAMLAGECRPATTGFIFEGATADAFELLLTVVDPTADRTITFPELTGTVLLTTSSAGAFPTLNQDTTGNATTATTATTANAVAANSVALGTDTTGGYAASATEGGSATSVAANSVALTTDTTGSYAAGDAEAGNATGVACTTCVDATDIAAEAVTEPKLDAIDAAGDEEVLTYESDSGRFEWQASAAGIGGSTGATDNAILAADGTGGATLQARDLTVSDVASTTVTVATTAGNALAMAATSPTATTGASQAGKAATLTASNAVASTDTAGAAAGGAVTITAGNAARLTSGDANGGNVTLVPGAGIGSGVGGQVIPASGYGFVADTTNFGATATLRVSDGSTGFKNISALGLYLKTGGNIASLLSGSGTLRARNHQDSAYTSLHAADLQSYKDESLRLFAARGSAARVAISSDGVWGFSSTTDAEGTLDGALSRSAAGVTAFGTGAAGNTDGKAKALNFLAGGTASPTIGGSCGTDPAIAGKDGALKVTTGTGSPTSCAVTFGTAWTTAPVCVANASTTTTALNIATTTTTVTVSAVALTASETIHVLCMGY
jgi:hypothetical protein